MEYLQGKELARRLNWPPGRIDRLMFYRRENGLNKVTIKMGKTLLIDYEGFLQWLEDHREAPVTRDRKCNPRVVEDRSEKSCT